MKNNIEVNVKTGDFKAEVKSKSPREVVAVTYRINPDTKERLQLLSFLEKKPQDTLVEKALDAMIRTANVKMPDSCKIFFDK